MKNQFSTKSEQMLRDMTLARIKASRSEFSDKYLHVEGKFYKFAAVASYITAIYSFIIFLAQLIGAYFLTLDYKTYNPEKYAAAQNDMRNCLIICIILLVAIIALFMKKSFAYSVLSIAFALFYFINSTFAEIIIQKSEINRLIIFLPAVILLAASAIYVLSAHIIDYTEFKRGYARLVDKIIATYPTGEGEITTAEQWEKYIEQYNEPAFHQKPKKSLRLKQRKNNEVSDD